MRGCDGDKLLLSSRNVNANEAEGPLSFWLSKFCLELGGDVHDPFASRGHGEDMSQ